MAAELLLTLLLENLPAPHQKARLTRPPVRRPSVGLARATAKGLFTTAAQALGLRNFGSKFGNMVSIN